MEYIAYLHKDAKSDYGVSFPDFPGCVTAGSTLEEAREMASEALALHIAGMREDGEDIPAPSTLDDLRGDPAMRGAVAFLVRPAESEKTVRINITVPERQLARIDELARKRRQSRSAFLVGQAVKAAEESRREDDSANSGRARTRLKAKEEVAMPNASRARFGTIASKTIEPVAPHPAQSRVRARSGA